MSEIIDPFESLQPVQPVQPVDQQDEPPDVAQPFWKKDSSKKFFKLFCEILDAEKHVKVTYSAKYRRYYAYSSWGVENEQKATLQTSYITLNDDKFFYFNNQVFFQVLRKIKKKYNDQLICTYELQQISERQANYYYQYSDTETMNNIYEFRKAQYLEEGVHIDKDDADVDTNDKGGPTNDPTNTVK